MPNDDTEKRLTRIAQEKPNLSGYRVVVSIDDIHFLLTALTEAGREVERLKEQLAEIREDYKLPKIGG